MLDLKFIRENKEAVEKALRDRNSRLDLAPLLQADDERRKVLSEIEELRALRNKANDEIGALLKEKKDARDKIESMRGISSRIGIMEDMLRGMEAKVNGLLLTVPNIPHESVPVGEPAKAEIVRAWGTPRQFDFTPGTGSECGFFARDRKGFFSHARYSLGVRVSNRWCGGNRCQGRRRGLSGGRRF